MEVAQNDLQGRRGMIGIQQNRDESAALVQSWTFATSTFERDLIEFEAAFLITEPAFETMEVTQLCARYVGGDRDGSFAFFTFPPTHRTRHIDYRVGKTVALYGPGRPSDRALYYRSLSLGHRWSSLARGGSSLGHRSPLTVESGGALGALEASVASGSRHPGMPAVRGQVRRGPARPVVRSGIPDLG